MILGPEPCADVIAKAAEVLDYKIAMKCFFKDRRLYVQPYIHSITEKNDKPKDIRNSSKERKKNSEMAVVDTIALDDNLGYSTEVTVEAVREIEPLDELRL